MMRIAHSMYLADVQSVPIDMAIFLFTWQDTSWNAGPFEMNVSPLGVGNPPVTIQGWLRALVWFAFVVTTLFVSVVCSRCSAGDVFASGLCAAFLEGFLGAFGAGVFFADLGSFFSALSFRRRFGVVFCFFLNGQQSATAGHPRYTITKGFCISTLLYTPNSERKHPKK